MSVRISDEWLNKLIAAGFPKEDLCIGVAEEILRRLPVTLSEYGTFWLHISPKAGQEGWFVGYTRNDDGYEEMKGH